MFTRSISADPTDATVHSALATIRAYNRSRAAGVRSFESRRPETGRLGSNTTAAATTGPAKQPRPTSSTPATRRKPCRLRAFSIVRLAEERNLRSAQKQARTFKVSRLPLHRTQEGKSLESLTDEQCSLAERIGGQKCKTTSE